MAMWCPVTRVVVECVRLSWTQGGLGERARVHMVAIREESSWSLT